MNVCGVLVHVAPLRVAEVRAALVQLPGVEIHSQTDDARLVVTVEDTAASTALDSLSAIHRTDGVVAAALVYHEFDAAPAAA